MIILFYFIFLLCLRLYIMFIYGLFFGISCFLDSYLYLLWYLSCRVFAALTGLVGHICSKQDVLLFMEVCTY